MTSSSPAPTTAPTSVRTCHTFAVISARTSVIAANATGVSGRSSAAIGQEAEPVPDLGDLARVDVGEEDALGPSGTGEHLAERIEDAAVARVREPTSLPDPVDADDVGLVLDRPSLQQRLPVGSTGLRPVRAAQVDVRVRGERPPVVGEAEVVAHEEAESQPFDLHGHRLGARLVRLVL